MDVFVVSSEVEAQAPRARQRMERAMSDLLLMGRLVPPVTAAPLQKSNLKQSRARHSQGVPPHDPIPRTLRTSAVRDSAHRRRSALRTARHREIVWMAGHQTADRR